MRLMDVAIPNAEEFDLDLPFGTKVLDVVCGFDFVPRLYYVCEPARTPIRSRFVMLALGEIPSLEAMHYVGTIELIDGPRFIWTTAEVER